MVSSLYPQNIQAISQKKLLNRAFCRRAFSILRKRDIPLSESTFQTPSVDTHQTGYGTLARGLLTGIMRGHLGVGPSASVL